MDNLASVGIQQAYEWVKTGHWPLKTFSAWVMQRHSAQHQATIGIVTALLEAEHGNNDRIAHCLETIRSVKEGAKY